MKILNLGLYLIILVALHFTNLLDFRNIRGFVNLPFDEQMSYFPRFKEWKDKYEGKFNVIFIHHGGEPYAVFTKQFFPNATDAETVNLKEHGAEEITQEFLKRGFVIADYKKQLEEELENMDNRFYEY